MDSKGSKGRGWVVAGLIGGAVIVSLAVLGSGPPPSGEDEARRIEASCRREFAGNDSAIANCQLQLLTEAIEKREGGRMQRARAAAY